MNSKAKLVRGFKRHRDNASQEKTSGWQFKVRVYNKVIKLINEYPGEITSSESFKGIKGIGPKVLEKIDTILAEENVEEDELNTNIKVVEDLTRITGVGPKRAQDLASNGYTLDRILTEYKKGSLDESLFTHHILIGIKYFHDFEKKIPLQLGF